jgi:hypothetical protein
MRLSASRIRSLSIRYALAEAAAFPGIGLERVNRTINRTATAEIRHHRPLIAHEA